MPGDQEKKKVFISYSMRNKSQAELLKHQIQDDRYELEFIDTSLKNPVKHGNWKTVVSRKIEQSDAVICMIGEDTHTRSAVAWEVSAAYTAGKTVIPVQIHPNKDCEMPEPIVREGDTSISWKLDDIQYEVETA